MKNYLTNEQLKQFYNNLSDDWVILKAREEDKLFVVKINKKYDHNNFIVENENYVLIDKMFNLRQVNYEEEWNAEALLMYKLKFEQEVIKLKDFVHTLFKTEKTGKEIVNKYKHKKEANIYKRLPSNEKGRYSIDLLQRVKEDSLEK